MLSFPSLSHCLLEKFWGVPLLVFQKSKFFFFLVVGGDGSSGGDGDGDGGGDVVVE